MAFSGEITVTKVGGSVCRISGVSLGPDTSGEIGLHGSGAEVELPVNWIPYRSSQGAVDLVEACEVSIQFVEEPELPQDGNIYVTKEDGGDSSAFRIYVNQPTQGEIGDGSEMEIYIRYHN